jgi:hypothetical protein
VVAGQVIANAQNAAWVQSPGPKSEMATNRQDGLAKPIAYLGRRWFGLMRQAAYCCRYLCCHPFSGLAVSEM